MCVKLYSTYRYLAPVWWSQISIPIQSAKRLCHPQRDSKTYCWVRSCLKWTVRNSKWGGIWPALHLRTFSVRFKAVSIMCFHLEWTQSWNAPLGTQQWWDSWITSWKWEICWASAPALYDNPLEAPVPFFCTKGAERSGRTLPLKMELILLTEEL